MRYFGIIHAMVLEPESIVGSYRVIRPLGEGGMGAVYEVEHVQLGVRYALKTYTLADEHADLFRKRFAAEGKILARLNHPNLVRVIDLDWDEPHQLLYYVMDLVLYKDGEARTLADLEPGGADEDWIFEWFRELCGALAYVHTNGIVHRDIKLNNILLAPDKHVVLSDFGISRVCGEQMRRAVGSTQTTTMATGGLIVGTQGYMAPEVANGETATPAADIYSLGVVFFKLLTGVWYDADLAPSETNTNTTNAVKLLADFERPWKDVLPAMLATDPAKRPADLATLPARLTPSSTGEATSSSLPSKKARRGRRAYIYASMAIALVLAGVATWFFLRPAPTAPDDDALMDEAFEIPNAAK